MIWGEKRYAMRMWLDPAKLAGYQMTPLDVRNAIAAKTLSSLQEASKEIPRN